MTVKRRDFIATATVGAGAAAASTIAAPAIAQSAPEVRWRVASSFPKSLDTIYGGAETLAKRVSDLTDGKFQIRVFAAGEIVPGLQVLDAVQQGTVEAGHTCAYYYVGKDPTFAFDTAMPFGLNMRQQQAWMYEGGGEQLMNDFYKEYNVRSFVCGNTGTQMGGWFRKEIKGLEDIKGLKMRIAGLAGQVLAKLGGVPQQIAGGDIYPALEKGTIDGAEWVGPYDDEKLGFYKVAKFYYYPGWWEGGPAISFFTNTDKYNELPKAYQAALAAASAEANNVMMAKYDVQNQLALRRLVSQGVQLRPYSRDILEACYKATHELYEEISKTNPKFAKVYTEWKKFRDEQYLWFRVAENTLENFVYTQSAKK